MQDTGSKVVPVHIWLNLIWTLEGELSLLHPRQSYQHIMKKRRHWDCLWTQSGFFLYVKDWHLYMDGYMVTCDCQTFIVEIKKTNGLIILCRWLNILQHVFCNMEKNTNDTNVFGNVIHSLWYGTLQFQHYIRAWTLTVSQQGLVAPFLLGLVFVFVLCPLVRCTSLPCWADNLSSLWRATWLLHYWNNRVPRRKRQLLQKSTYSVVLCQGGWV